MVAHRTECVHCRSVLCATDRGGDDFAYKISLEWWVFAGAGLLAVAIALLTVGFQSVKAALMNPVESLRSD